MFKLKSEVKMLQSKELVINVIVLLSWLVVMPVIIFRVFDQFAVWAVALFGLVMLGMLAAFIYGRRSSALVGLTRDERTEQYSAKASRNGFLLTVVLTAVLIAAVWLRGSQMETLDLLIWIWSWAIGAYMLSYLYYVMKG